VPIDGIYEVQLVLVDVLEVFDSFLAGTPCGLKS